MDPKTKKKVFIILEIGVVIIDAIIAIVLTLKKPSGVETAPSFLQRFLFQREKTTGSVHTFFLVFLFYILYNGRHRRFYRCVHFGTKRLF